MLDRAQKKSIWGWMLFDWASQPYNTLLITFIFAPYFANYVVGDATEGQAVWGYTVGTAGILIAILAPILGAYSDATGPRKPWIFLFSVMYIVGSFLLWWAVPGMEDYKWILLAFAVGLIGMEFATIFTNAYLPELGPREEVGRLSGNGWALGYVGGLITLVIMLGLFVENTEGVTMLGKPPAFGLDPSAFEGNRIVGPLTSVWYIIFIIPFFLWVKDAPKRADATGAVKAGLSEVKTTIRNLPKTKSLFAFLGASMFYRDALNGIYTFGGIYAAGVLGWSIIEIGTFGILAIISGALFAWLGGKADRKNGPKPVIVVSILVLISVVFVILMIERDSVFLIPVEATSSLPDILFYLCGILIGAAGGTIQAASRTMMVRQATPGKMTEAFGLYALSGKATAFLAPMAIGIATDISKSQSIGVSPVIALFLIGLVLLIWVKPDGETGTSHETS